MRGNRLDHLEELAEELIKENPEETVVRAHMKAAGLKYSDDACERLTQVLQHLDDARQIKNFDRAPKVNHGKNL